MVTINTWYSGLLNKSRQADKYDLRSSFTAEAKKLQRRTAEQVRKATMPEHKSEALYIIENLKNAHTYQVVIALGSGYRKTMSVLTCLKLSGNIKCTGGFNRGAKTVVWSKVDKVDKK